MGFTASEIDYLASKRVGRLATAQPDGTLQVSPVGFGYNSDTETIDIGGFNMSASRKFRNVTDNERVAYVVDDVASVSPWRVRCVEIRGRGEAIETPTDAQAQVTDQSFGCIPLASSASGSPIPIATPKRTLWCRMPGTCNRPTGCGCGGLLLCRATPRCANVLGR